MPRAGVFPSPAWCTGSFTGVRLRDLLAMAGPRPQGTWVAFTARDGYSESLPMSLVQGAPEIIVAYELDGAPLPMIHGFPARMICLLYTSDAADDLLCVDLGG